MKNQASQPLTAKPTRLKPEFENKGAPKRQFLNIKKLSNFGRLLLWLFSETKHKVQIFQMISAFHTMHRKNGSVFLVQYMKESHRLTLKVLSGFPEECKTFPRVGTKRGIPLIIPWPLRREIEERNKVIIQLVLSLLTVYRVIKIPSILKINTITDLFNGKSPTLPLWEVREALQAMRVKYNFVVFKDAYLMPSTTAGPNSKISVLGATLDAWAFKEAPELLSAFRTLSTFFGPSLMNLLDEEMSYLPTWFTLLKGGLKEILHSKLKLGKLSEKIEAAGKVRIFAITDVWTQSLLRPLHDALLRVLRHYPMDGTFDQLAPVKHLYEKGHKKLYSFDLTAATDRLPIELQKQVLSILIGQAAADAWAILLVKRPWYLKFVPYYYSVGQPMGALSSWAMLALTHHCMVQISARRCGSDKIFTDYALLGDDLVIADEAVARCYLALASDLGVSINMDKSIVSEESVLEFAKRIFSAGEDWSPLPPKLIASLLRGLRDLPQVLRDMVGRGLSAQTDVVITDPKIKSRILWEIIGPLGFVNTSTLLPFLGNKDLDEETLRLICESVVTVVNRRLIRSFYRMQNESQLVISKLTNLIYDGLKEKRAYSVDKYVHEYALESEKPWSGFLLPEEVEYEDTPWPYDTPALQSIVNTLIEDTIRKNSTQPEQLVMPEGPYTLELVSDFIREGWDRLDTLETVVADLSIQTSPKVQNSNKMQFYRELEGQLSRLS